MIETPVTNLVLANAIRGIILFGLAVASTGTGILMIFKKQYYTTIRAAIVCMYIGLLGFFVIFTAFLIDRTGHPLSLGGVVMLVSAVFYDTGVIWALWKNKLFK